MNLTKRDVLELRRRLTKKDCTISRVCGCYVNGNREVILKFAEPFSDLEEEEFHKYLEIVKKPLSGTIGNNLLELSFLHGQDAEERQQFLLALKASKLKNDSLLDRLYEQVMAHYSYPGNYLILVFHDIYDVVARASDRSKLDESEEIYEYLVCAVCPVELSKPGLGYCEEENRIGARARDWVVGPPDLGFVYPAFVQRGSDISAVIHYLKNPKETHPAFIEQVLGCAAQRTATQEKTAFESIVKEAFGAEEDKAEAAFYKIQRDLNGIVEDTREEEAQPPVCITTSTVSDMVTDLALPEDVRKQITRSYAQTFGDTPPVAQNLLDAKLVATGAQQARTVELEQQVSTLQEKLAAVAAPIEERAPWEDEGDSKIILHVPKGKTDQIKAQMVDGRKCLVIPVDDGESASINGVSAEL